MTAPTEQQVEAVRGGLVRAIDSLVIEDLGRIFSPANRAMRSYGEQVVEALLPRVSRFLTATPVQEPVATLVATSIGLGPDGIHTEVRARIASGALSAADVWNAVPLEVRRASVTRPTPAAADGEVERRPIDAVTGLPGGPTDGEMVDHLSGQLNRALSELTAAEARVAELTEALARAEAERDRAKDAEIELRAASAMLVAVSKGESVQVAVEAAHRARAPHTTSEEGIRG